MPKVSVIVPVYNVEKYIEKCLESLVNQTLEDIEIIVVNDGSPDNSQKIIDKFVKKYPKKVKSYTKENGGLSDARNYGIEKATGEYIAFLDSDDYIREDAYEKMYHKAIEKKFDVVVCDLVYVYDNYEKNANSNIQKDITNKEEIKKIYENIYPAAWNKIYHKKLFNNKKIRFKKGVWYEDVEFTYKLLPFIKTIGVVKENFVYYIQRENSISKTYDKRLYDQINNWNALIDYYKENNLYNEYKKELEYAYIRYICGSFIKQCANYPDKKEYQEAVKIALENRNKNFPQYKKNKLFYKNGLKGLYLLFFNKLIANIYFMLKK